MPTLSLLVGGLIDDAYDHGVHRSVFAANCNACAAAGYDQNVLADTCADGLVHCNHELICQHVFFNDLHLQELEAAQRIKLVGGNNGSNYFSF